MPTERSPAVLATVWRGSAPEAVIRGHLAVVDATGNLVAGAGDPGALTTLRSAAKPIQAMQLAGVAQRLAISEAELAIACASHSAERPHIEAVRQLLRRAGVNESLLSCGPQLPYDQTEAARRILSQDPLRPIDNNCSGKHAGMLAACVVNGWPLEGYARREHPLQQAIDRDLAALSGCDVAAAPTGIDGCGLPTHALPLHGLARAFARGLGDERFRRCQGAMAAHPLLVGGTGTFDTVLLGLAGARVTAKSGAYGVWAGVVRPNGPAVAIKLEAGWSEHLPGIACAALVRLNVLKEPLPAELAELTHRRIRNRAGDVVGELRLESPGR